MRYFLILLLLCVPFASAYQVFWYADEIDRENSISYADRNPFDGIEQSDFAFKKYNCISLDAYNRFANSNSFDSYDPITASSAKSVLKKLRRGDLNRLANENPYDSLEPDNYGFDDMDCWTLSDYNGFANTKKYDSWKPATLRDPDNFNRVIRNVGKKRFHFFDYRDLLDLR
ncbi:hypothetical protein KY329_02870 [Candidatus Woesearchaeota archaeon]|nr:hypothetical protein [Candidatus Woesearchaeota archaeon]